MMSYKIDWLYIRTWKGTKGKWAYEVFDARRKPVEWSEPIYSNQLEAKQAGIERLQELEKERE